MSQLRKSSPVTGVDTLRTALAPLRDQLLNHPIYASVNTLPRLRCFMRYHVFAVWDFMCLAKRLQRDLTSLDVLWLPPARPALARFINSLILAEETDLDPRWRRRESLRALRAGDGGGWRVNHGGARVPRDVA